MHLVLEGRGVKGREREGKGGKGREEEGKGGKKEKSTFHQSNFPSAQDPLPILSQRQGCSSSQQYLCCQQWFGTN